MKLTMLQDIITSSDRVLIITMVALFESRLKDILRAYFIDDEDNTAERILNPMGGAISSFTVMLDTIYLVGLLSNKARKVLKSMAHLRNIFAHHHDIRNFEDFSSSKHNETINKFRKKCKKFITSSNQDVEQIDPRDLFLALSPTLRIELSYAKRHAQQVKRKEKADSYMESGIHFRREVESPPGE